jgi:hypothetical protein
MIMFAMTSTAYDEEVTKPSNKVEVIDNMTIMERIDGYS